MTITTQKKRRLVEWGIIAAAGAVLASLWFILIHLRSDLPALHDNVRRIEVEGRVPIPYFVLAVDQSASMEKVQSDPHNYERESVKQALRFIMWNGYHLHEATGYFPRIQIIGFSGAPAPITEENRWVELRTEEDVLRLDAIVDHTLKERRGQFTDINAVTEFFLNRYSTIPPVVGSGDSQRPTAMICILFTDGGIYPNYLNAINHENPDAAQSFKNMTIKLMRELLPDEKEQPFIEELNTSVWMDPVEWVKAHCAPTAASSFLSRYYALNEGYGITDNRYRLDYARDQIQSIFLKKIINLDSPPLRFNVVALLQKDSDSDEISYLKKWTERTGFFHHIRKADNLGAALSGIMAGYLNSFTETFAVSGSKRFPPFSKDIAAAELTFISPEQLPPSVFENLIELSTPGGSAVATRLNENLDFSRSFYISSRQYDDFYDAPGWLLKIKPLIYENKVYEKVLCTFTTIHLYVLDIRPSEKMPADLKKTRYIVRIVDPHEGLEVPFDTFSELPEIHINMIDGSANPGDYDTRVNRHDNTIEVDFIGWPSGKYNVLFQLAGGRMKNDLSSLRTKSVAKTVYIGEKIQVYNEKGQPIDRLGFDSIDRK